MGLLLAAIVALTGLVVAPGQFFYFDITPKVAILLGGTAVACFGVRSRGEVRPLTTKIFGALVLLDLISLAISTAFSGNVNLALYGGTWRRFGLVEQCAVMLFAWLVVLHCSARPAGRKTILRAVALASIASAAYGIAQYFGWDPILPRAAYHIGEGLWTIVRPPGTLGYASYFATWLLMSVFLSLELARLESGIWKWISWIAAALGLLAMLLTGTRAAILGLAAGVLVWVIARRFRWRRWWAMAALVCALCGTLFYYSPAGRQMRSRGRWFAEDPWGGARLLLWRDSLSMARHRLVAGYGPELFYPEFPHFESKALARAYPDFVHESPHNIFLDALVSQGVPGCAILLGLCAVGFWTAWRQRAWWLAAALAAGIVSQQFTVFTVPTALILFTAIALALAHPSDKESSPIAESRQPALNFALPIVALGLLYVAVRLSVADYALATTKRRVDMGAVRAASATYEDYRRWRLPGTSADIWYSRSLMDVVRKGADLTIVGEAANRAAEAAERAPQTAEDPFDAWYNLAEIRADYNDYRGTEDCLRAAIAAHPVWFKPHWMLARMLALESRREEAAAEAAVAVDLDAGKDSEVTETLRQIRARL